MTDVGILSLPSGSGALPISTIVGRGPSLRRVLGLDREGPPPRAAKLGWDALDLAGPEASADLAPKVPTSVIYGKDHSRPDQHDHHPDGNVCVPSDPDLAPEALTPVIYDNGQSQPEQRDRQPRRRTWRSCPFRVDPEGASLAGGVTTKLHHRATPALHWHGGLGSSESAIAVPKTVGRSTISQETVVAGAVEIIRCPQQLAVQHLGHQRAQ
jgi:hypothetical protein